MIRGRLGAALFSNRRPSTEESGRLDQLNAAPLTILSVRKTSTASGLRFVGPGFSISTVNIAAAASRELGSRALAPAAEIAVPRGSKALFTAKIARFALKSADSFCPKAARSFRALSGFE